MGGLIEGPAAVWLERHRDGLNARVKAARARWPTLDEEALRLGLALALGQTGGQASLCEVTFDLTLLHVARGSTAQPGVRWLLEEGIAALRPVLEPAPSLLARVSNAVERMGPAGLAWARGLAGVAASLTPGQVEAAGVVLAWRLGEARLREVALDAALGLPDGVVASLLGVEDAGLALRRLHADAWVLPAGEIARGWSMVGRVGGFVGFGGVFSAPPVVLDGGDRHRLFVRVGGEVFGVLADRFGAVARPVDDPGLTARVPLMPGLVDRLIGGDGLLVDGSLRVGGQVVRLEGAAGASAWRLTPGLLVVSHADSHWLRVWRQGTA